MRITFHSADPEFDIAAASLTAFMSIAYQMYVKSPRFCCRMPAMAKLYVPLSIRMGRLFVSVRCFFKASRMLDVSLITRYEASSPVIQI